MYIKDFSINSSTSSSVPDFNENREFVKNLLKSRIFLGRYLERRLIDEHIGYRDVVLVSAAEVELKKDLRETIYKLQTAFPNTRWIGITDTDTESISNSRLPSGILLWTEIDNQPFGVFWFQIRNVKFRLNEIIVTLRCVRHISEAFLEVEPVLSKVEANHLKDDSNSAVNSVHRVSLNDTISSIKANLHNSFSLNNFKEFMTFLFALIIAAFTGSTSLVNFIGNFVLALIREISILIKNSTPLFLGILDFSSKIVGGFYILLAMMFKPNNQMPRNTRSVAFYKPQQQQKSEWGPRDID